MTQVNTARGPWIKQHQAFLKASTCIPLPPLKYEQFKSACMFTGLENGFLRLTDDVAYAKSTRRQRTIVVDTTPEERASWDHLR